MFHCSTILVTLPWQTYFVLHVRIGASSWNVRRRFKDFDLLYSSLCAAYGKAIVPPVPPKQLLKNESPEFLLRRSQLLSTFLDGVLADKILSMSPEVCAFLECEAGAALTRVNSAISTCAAIVVTELANAERQTTSAASALANRDAEIVMLQASLATAVAERDAAASNYYEAIAQRDAATDHMEASRLQVLSMVCRGRRERQMQYAMYLWAAGTPQRQEPEVPEVAPVNPLTAALTAAIHAMSADKPGAAAPAPAAPGATAIAEATEVEDAEPTSEAEAALDEAAAPSTPAAPKAAAEAAAAVMPSPPSEHAIKCGLLLKQGAGNKAFQERYFEMVTLGASGEYGAFLVYYDSELKQSVKGYISLDGASVSAVQHPTEPYAMLLTTPARRLNVLTPTNGPSPKGQNPFKAGLDGLLRNVFNEGNHKGSLPNDAENGSPNKPAVFDCPPSLEAKMNVMQKLDTWGRLALRNAMAQGPGDDKYTTWSLAATSALELQSWLDGFTQVLGETQLPAGLHSPLGSKGYEPVGAGRTVSRTPVLVAPTEEVM